MNMYVYIYIHIYMFIYVYIYIGLPWWLSGIESACNGGDVDSVPGSGRSLEKEMATRSSSLTRDSGSLH